MLQQAGLWGIALLVIDHLERPSPNQSTPARCVFNLQSTITNQQRFTNSKIIKSTMLYLGATHLKFFASSMLPSPEWRATCGYGQSGRERVTCPLTTLLAMIVSGAVFFSTQLITAVTASF